MAEDYTRNSERCLNSDSVNEHYIITLFTIYILVRRNLSTPIMFLESTEP
jgi:hypothetical protein